MAYKKQTFKDNATVLKAEHLNHIEDGIVANEKAIGQKQDTLVSGTSIKTINGQSILGSGNIDISGTGGSLFYDIVSEFSGGTTGGGDTPDDNNPDDDKPDVPSAVALATDSWETIAAAIKSGTHPYAVRDTKIVSVGGTDYTLRLCDLSTSRYEYTDGSGKTNAVFEFVEPYGQKQYINSADRTNVGGYAATLTPEYLSGTVFPALPPDLQAVIPSIKIPYCIGGQSTTIQTLDCKLFLASAYELTGDSTNNTGAAEGSPQYQLRVSESDTNIKYFNGNATYWWTRTPNNAGSMDYYAINTTGVLQSLGSLGNQCIVPFFAI